MLHFVICFVANKFAVLYQYQYLSTGETGETGVLSVTCENLPWIRADPAL